MADYLEDTAIFKLEEISSLEKKSPGCYNRRDGSIAGRSFCLSDLCIDVVVQTAVRFRDLVASRLYLINKAGWLLGALNETGPFENHFRSISAQAEEALKDKRRSPVEAREIYGAQIMGIVEAGDKWGEGAGRSADTSQQYG